MGEINKSVPDINKIYAFENSSYSWVDARNCPDTLKR